LGLQNLLCTSGSHQTLGQFRAAKNVYDVDVVQLLQCYANLAKDASIVGEAGIAGADGFCLGAVASPEADPLELQVMRLGKKATAGAAFFITQPVDNLERFAAWWAEVTRRGIHEKVAILAGIQAPGDATVGPALETIKRLSDTKGLRGFSVSVDGSHDAALEIIEKSGLGKN